MGKPSWRQELQYLVTPMKCLLFFIGFVMSGFGYVMFCVLWIEMTTASEPGYTSSDYAAIMVVLGVLPFVCGIALCIFVVRKWLKKWLKSMKNKLQHPAAESGNANPVDPEAAVLNHKAIVFTIFGVLFVLSLSILMMWWLDLPLWLGLPILLLLLLAVPAGALLGKKLANEDKR